jgi:hypothetical protein
VGAKNMDFLVFCDDGENENEFDEHVMVSVLSIQEKFGMVFVTLKARYINNILVFLAFIYELKYPAT